MSVGVVLQTRGRFADYNKNKNNKNNKNNSNNNNYM